MFSIFKHLVKFDCFIFDYFLKFLPIFEVFFFFFFDKLDPLKVCFKICFKYLFGHSGAKDCFGSAKNVVFFLFCILVDRIML